MKRLRAFSIVVASLSAVYACAIDVNVNSNRVVFTDATPYQKSGVIMVPIRPVLDEMHINFDWNQESRQMTATENDNWVKVTVGSSILDANGQSLTMETPATWKNGRLYVPIRFFAEALGAQVDWNKESQTAEINGRIDVSTGASEILTANIAPALALESENKTWYEAGDVMKFSLQANQGITPMLYLDGGNAAIPMTEEKPGFYIASYTVPTGQSGEAILGTEAPYASVPYQNGELVVSINRNFYSEPEELTSVPEASPNLVTDNPVYPDSLAANTNPPSGNDSDADQYNQDPNLQYPSVQYPDRYVPTEPVPNDPVPYKYIPTEPIPYERTEPVEVPVVEPPMFLSPSLNEEFSYRQIAETLKLSGMAPGARTIRISVRPACHLDGLVAAYGFLHSVEVDVNSDGSWESPEIEVSKVDGKVPSQFIVKLISVSQDGQESEKIEEILEN